MEHSLRRKSWILCIVLLAPELLLAAQPEAPLPDAPVPVRALPAVGSGAGPPQTGAPVSVPRYAPLYARTIFPYETARRLSPREKFLYAGRQMVEPINLVPGLLSAGWSQYTNGDPRYGAGSSAFAQRFGASIAREDTGRLFTDALLPVLLHEDPRYYRRGETSNDFNRTAYAIGQTFVSRTDAGRSIPNYSGFLGRAMALGLTYAYYPPSSRSGGVMLRGFGTSLGGLAAFNLLREFVPRDVFSHLTVFRDPDAGSPPLNAPANSQK